MKHIKLTLAISLTALAFLCACDDSSSAKEETPENDATPALPQTQTPSDVFSKQEKYTYMFVANDETCGWTTDITDMQYDFGPGSSVKITTTDADGTEIDTGVYRQTTDEEGYDYYLIQIKDGADMTLNYYPNGAAYIITKEGIVFVSDNKQSVVDLAAEICSK